MVANSGNRGQVIWPIAQKLFKSVMCQQRPRWTGGRRIGVGSDRFAGTRPPLPWDDTDRPPVINYGRVDKPPIASMTLPKNFSLCALRVVPVSLSDIRVQQINSPLVNKQPSVVHSLKPMPATTFYISGVSKDNTGAVLGNCIMSLFRVEKDPTNPNYDIYTFISRCISDASGNYYFNVGLSMSYQITGTDGAETVWGITLNNLTGVLK